MLTKLEIKNVALIDNATIEFEKNLNVLTGETGSGKSVILDSLNFVLGARADKDLIRTGENECLVSAFFTDLDANVKNFLSNIEIEDDEIVISRKFNSDGKNSIRINGIPIGVGVAKQLASLLIDIHGQSDQYSLISQTNQLKLIDNFGGKNIFSIKEKLNRLIAEYSDLTKKMNNYDLDESHREIKLDILKYQINEIESAELNEGEEENLLIQKQKAIYREKINNALNSAKNAFNDEGGILDRISNAYKEFHGIAGISKDFDEFADRLSSAFDECKDISDSIDDLSEDDDDYVNIDYIESRLDLIKKLKKKYGNTISEILQFLDRAKEEQEILNNFNIIFENQLIEKDRLQKEIYKLYGDLHQERIKFSKDFSERVCFELKELGMTNSIFEISFSDLANIEDCNFNSANGVDNVEFMFSANLGEPLKKLSSVISGGEISRFMLAVKSQSAKYSSINTFIFDEIDSGISGNTATTVAKKLYKISKDNQVIAISHLPQIASFADHNILIRKVEYDNSTKTIVKSIKGDELIEELTRLVGGKKESNTAIQLACELIENAKIFKTSL